jgi:hypothetical protein
MFAVPLYFTTCRVKAQSRLFAKLILDGIIRCGSAGMAAENIVLVTFSEQVLFNLTVAHAGFRSCQALACDMKQQRLEKFFKRDLLFGCKQIDVTIVVKQKSPDSQHRAGQVLCPGDGLFNVVGIGVNQKVEKVQVDFFHRCSPEKRYRCAVWAICMAFGRIMGVIDAECQPFFMTAR